MPVQIARPTSSVAEGFAPLLANNYALVSDEDTATYVSFPYNPGVEDRYGWPDLPADATAVSSVGFGWTGSSLAVDHNARVKLWLGASTGVGTTRGLTATVYVWVETALARPGGGSWSVADVNALDAGVELVSGSALADARVHEMYRFVHYTSSNPPAPGDAEAIEMGGGSPPVEWESDSVVAMPPTASELDLGDNPVDIVAGWHAAPSIEMNEGGV